MWRLAVARDAPWRDMACGGVDLLFTPAPARASRQWPQPQDRQCGPNAQGPVLSGLAQLSDGLPVHELEPAPLTRKEGVVAMASSILQRTTAHGTDACR